jgi:hypothetical protein
MKKRRNMVREETPGYGGGAVVLYRAPDGTVSLDVRVEKETVWLSQRQMAELFATERSVITKHLRNIFQSGELESESNVQKVHIAGSDRPVAFYNLDVAVSVGYRVNSKRGTQFRIWATRVLRDHILKGYSVNERRLKELRQSLRLVGQVLDRYDVSSDQIRPRWNDSVWERPLRWPGHSVHGRAPTWRCPCTCPPAERPGHLWSVYPRCVRYRLRTVSAKRDARCLMLVGIGSTKNHEQSVGALSVQAPRAA